MNNIDEITSIRSTIELYIDGTKKADIEKLRYVFDSKAVMSGYLVDNQMTCASTELFFNDIKGKQISPKYDAQIVSIDITDKIATATLIEKDLLGLNFVNYFHLQKIDEKWKIVSKCFTSL